MAKRTVAYQTPRDMRRAWRMFYIQIVIIFVVLMMMVFGLGFGGWLTYKVVTLSPGLPTVEQLTKKQPTMSIVLDQNGSKICEVGMVKHDHINANEIPKMVKNAVIAAEDQRFYNHGGIDYPGIVRAGIKGLLAGHLKQGGSTITQQVAKNYLLTREKTFDRKIKEAVIATRIEKKFSKEEILELYLNKVNYGDGRYGIETASKYYFGRGVSEASLAQIALLIGIHPSPSNYNPRKNLVKAKGRQKYVLDRMLDENMITQAEYNSARNEPLTIVSDRDEDAKTGQEVCDYVNDWLKKRFEGNEEAISQLGWQIHTSIDIKLQAAAKEYLQNDVKAVAKRTRHRDAPEGAIVVMNVRREVIAMVGGPDYKPGGMNQALYAGRQPGSTFKGFVYAAGLEAHRFGTETELSNALITYTDYSGPWTPGNYRGEASDVINASVRYAYAHSLNTVAVKAICGILGPVQEGAIYPLEYCRNNGLVGETMALAEAVGIKWSGKEKKERNPSLALGSHDVTPVGLLNAYMSIAHDGNYVPPMIITKIVGEKAPSLPGRESTRVLSDSTVSSMRVLTHAVIEGGTGSKASGKLPYPAYGKTGTTNGSTNAWFVGGTDSYWAVVWIGYKGQNKSLGKDETGASAALPVWIDVMNAAYGRESNVVKAMRQTPKPGTEDEEGEVVVPGTPTAAPKPSAPDNSGPEW